MPGLLLEEHDSLIKDAARGLRDFPTPETLDLNERIVNSAVAVIRAVRGLRPQYCASKSSLRMFLILNHRYYTAFLRLCSLVHAIILPTYEPPPRLYASTSEVILDAGYSVRNGLATDVFVCFVFTVHCVMLWLTSSQPNHKTVWDRWRAMASPERIMVTVTVFLVIDCCINLARLYQYDAYGMRPFRFLRPSIYITLAPKVRTMAKACLKTWPPLVKTFLVLFASQAIYATLGVNLFEGRVTEETPYGAACLTTDGAQQTHPFANWGRGYVTMYYLSAGGDIWPDVTYAFFTCDCRFQSLNGTSYPSTELLDLDWCKTRQWVSVVFFVSYMLIVFVCLGNCILAVCYHFFDIASRGFVLHGIIRERLGLIASFHYISDLDPASGSRYVAKEKFDMVMDTLTKMKYVGRRKGAKMYHCLDTSGDGMVNMEEYFMLPEIIRTKISYHSAISMGWYSKFKKTRARNFLHSITQARTREIRGLGRLRILDTCIMAITCANGSLQSLSNTETYGYVFRFGILVVFLYFAEVIVKTLGDGPRIYFSDGWNQIDLSVTLICGVGYGCQWLVYVSVTDNETLAGYDSAFHGLQCLRYLRMIRLLKVAEMSTDADHGDRRNSIDSHDRLHGRQQLDTSSSLTSIPLEQDMHFNNFYRALIHAFSLSLPASMDLMILVFLFMCLSACIFMEIFSEYDINSKMLTYSTGTVNYIEFDTNQFDFSDFSTSMWTLLLILVQNTWSNVVEQIYSLVGFNYVLIPILFHFVGVFLMVNVIQSLFVFCFSILLDSKTYNETLEATIREHIDQLVTNSDQHTLKHAAERKKLQHAALHKRVSMKEMKMDDIGKLVTIKSSWRAPRMDYLLLQTNDLISGYRHWSKKAELTMGGTTILVDEEETANPSTALGRWQAQLSRMSEGDESGLQRSSRSEHMDLKTRNPEPKPAASQPAPPSVVKTGGLRRFLPKQNKFRNIMVEVWSDSSIKCYHVPSRASMMSATEETADERDDERDAVAQMWRAVQTPVLVKVPRMGSEEDGYPFVVFYPDLSGPPGSAPADSRLRIIAASAEERSEWVAAIRGAIKSHERSERKPPDEGSFYKKRRASIEKRREKINSLRVSRDVTHLVRTPVADSPTSNEVSSRETREGLLDWS